MRGNSYRYAYIVILCMMLLPVSLPLSAKEGYEKAIKARYDAWCAGLATAGGNGKKMTVFYEPAAILLPTLSPDILVNEPGSGVERYFDTLTALPDIKCTQGRFVLRLYGQTAVAAGTYMFSYREANQKIKKLLARFTFVYQKQGGQWMIVNQHSSLLPDKKNSEE